MKPAVAAAVGAMGDENDGVVGVGAEKRKLYFK
jgi:hypothetical protein